MSATDDKFTNLKKAFKKLGPVQMNFKWAGCDHLIMRIVELKNAIVEEAEKMGRQDDL